MQGDLFSGSGKAFTEVKGETMQKRKLGKSNLEVSSIGLGCMGMSFSYQPRQSMAKLLTR
jgi:hypothetical protein